ncbi:MAG: class I SAM-dependent methyltransferase [Bacteroidetes bacterium]|nr:MAG: class I SAM-dependent methyltransferase [Bacteroidota bacterium]
MYKLNAKMIPSGEDIIEMSGVETLHPGGFDLSKRIGELVNFNPSLHVLDVSSGKGTFACYYAQEFGCKVTGIDINKEFVRISINKAIERGLSGLVDFRIGDSTKLPFPDNSFDVVVNECAVGLRVINNPQGVLNEMVRVTKPDGTIVIHESIWLKELDQSVKDQLAMKVGTTPYTVEEWSNMLIKAGAKIKTVEDWSGIENIQKMRPDHKWNKKRPHDFLTFPEKLTLIPKIILKYGIGTLNEINKFQKEGLKYFNDGYYGYVLMVGTK